MALTNKKRQITAINEATPTKSKVSGKLGIWLQSAYAARNVITTSDDQAKLEQESGDWQLDLDYTNKI